MQTHYLLLIILIVAVLFWIGNIFWKQNVQRELEYRKKKYENR